MVRCNANGVKIIDGAALKRQIARLKPMGPLINAFIGSRRKPGCSVFNVVDASLHRYDN